MGTMNNGGPAFPQVGLDRISGQITDQHFGVSVRDYFAIKALTGLLAMEANPRIGVEVEPYSDKHAEQAARSAYFLADAMLAERAK